MTVINILRTPKIFNIAIFDCLATILFGLIIGKYILNIKNTFIMIIWIIALFIFGIIIHYLFGIKTMLGYYLGINDKPDRKV